MLFHDYFYTCNAQKNKKVGAQIYKRKEVRTVMAHGLDGMH